MIVKGRIASSSLNDILTVDARQNLFIQLYLSDIESRRVLYVHTPFCRQKCSYCVYNSMSDFTAEEFNFFYLRDLPNQIRRYEKLFVTVTFDEVYFGGGTPTIAEPWRLSAIFNSIPKFDSIPIKSIEASAATITNEHIDLLRSRQFSFVSLGVQSLDRKILKKQNREYVDPQRISNICSSVENAGIVCNVDLICYLKTGGVTDADQFENDLNYVLSHLRPISITIHSNLKTAASFKKTSRLLSLIREALLCHPEYRCVNSQLSDEDIAVDSLLSAEYRLMRCDFDFSHYMWNKFPTMPVAGVNIFSIGYYKNLLTLSNCRNYLMRGEDCILNVCQDSEVFHV